MSSLITELMERYGVWIITIMTTVVVVIGALVWLFTHLNAEPGEKVSVFWEMIKYTKSKSQIKPGQKESKEIGQTSKPITFKENIVITISIPQNGDMVSQFSDVEYRLKGELPEGYEPVLLIRDPLGQYWSWGITPSGSRKRVQFGVAEDSGREFEVGILITNVEIPLGQPTQILPKGIVYESVVVKRR